MTALLAAFFGGLALTDAFVEIFDRRRPLLAGAVLFVLAVGGVRLLGQPLSDPPLWATLSSTAVVVGGAYLVARRGIGPSQSSADSVTAGALDSSSSSSHSRRRAALSAERGTTQPVWPDSAKHWRNVPRHGRRT